MDKNTPPRPDAKDERPAAEHPAPGDPPPETGGRGGPDPVRYGDWEKGGIAVDF